MKEWYFISSGKESGYSFGLDEKTDLFYEALQSDLAVSALLCSHDLAECKNIRCMVLGNAPDSAEESRKRTALFFPGAVKAGMYLYYDENYWLISSCPGNNHIYEKVALMLCQYPLRWQNSSGKIIERWCSVSPSCKDSPKEPGPGPLILPSGALSLLLPQDEESLLLDGKRVFLDNRQAEPENVYRLTKEADILSDYGGRHGSVLSFTALRTELNPAADNQKLRICDYIPPAPEKAESSSDHTGQKAVILGRPQLKIGYPGSYRLQVPYEKEGNSQDAGFLWNLASSFSDSIRQTVNGTSIQLFVEDPALIGETFLLQVLAGGILAGELSITISDVY